MEFAIGMVMVQIILNGHKKEIQENTTLEQFLSGIELPKFYVVEKNMQIIYKENFANVILKNGDNVEIATFCGGG